MPSRTMRVMTLLMLCAFVCAEKAAQESQEASSTADASPLPDNLEKMRLKQLRALLEERGVQCHGCVEKSHVVEKVKESWHLPVLSVEELEARRKPAPKPAQSNEQPPNAPWGSGDPSYDDIMKLMNNKKKEEAEMMAKLKAAGINTDNLNFGSSGFGGGGGWPSGVPKPDAHYRANDKKTASKGKDDTNANQDEL